MNQFYIANQYGLKTGDRLVREKGIFSRHHGIYVGIHNGIPLVAENQIGEGVQYVSLDSFLLGNSASLKRIEKFRGTESARAAIIPRINNLVGTQYDLVFFNCEHFAEFIQHGNIESKQVRNAFMGVGGIIAVLGIFAAIGNNK